MRLSVALIVISCICILIFPNEGQAQKNEITITDGLTLVKLNGHLYQHISDLEFESSKVKCNGLIYVNGNEAIICDTPTNDRYSSELLQWFSTNHPGVKVKAIIVNHFHDDCLGGLKEFHRRGIKSYGHELGPELMKLKKDTFDIPQNLFSTSQEITVGNQKILNYYPGEAHTRDNIVTWIPAEKAIFGGCMVKAMDAAKGNLADANVKAWSATIRKVKELCPGATIIVPGHGDTGGTELLDYTIKLFE